MNKILREAQRLIRESGDKQKEAAKKLGITESNMSAFMSRGTGGNVDRVEKIFEVYNPNFLDFGGEK